ncbi:MAG: ATP synthase subunit I [Gallionella sp.]
MSKNVSDDTQHCLTPPKNAAIIAALFKVEAKEQKLARRVIRIQIVFVMAVAAIAFGVKGTPQIALAVLSGGGISVVNGAMLAWRMSRAALASVQNAHHQLRLMYFYAAERFLVVVALLGSSIATLRISPLALLGGFALGQAVLLTARLLLIRNKD